MTAKDSEASKQTKKTKRGLRANYKGATPEQVGRAMLRFRANKTMKRKKRKGDKGQP